MKETTKTTVTDLNIRNCQVKCVTSGEYKIECQVL